MPEWSFHERVPRGRLPEPPPPAPEVGPGERVGDHVLVRELGRGGRGVVFLARAPGGEEVALKLIRGTLNPNALQRFEREGSIAAALEHPGIVALRGSGHAGDVPYLVYELVPGARSLEEAAEGLDLRGRVGLVLQAARALGHAHSAGVIHRDVKPGNLLVDSAGRVRVSDFGLARMENAGCLTTTGEIVGTPWYMAPEQFFPDSSGPAMDVWGLGVVLYELLTGYLPFRGPTLARLISQVDSKPPMPPSQRNSAVSPRLEAVVLQALARRPADRTPDANALAADLASLYEECP